MNMKALLKMAVMESVLESVFGKASGLYQKSDWICKMYFGLFSVNFQDFTRNEVFDGVCFQLQVMMEFVFSKASDLYYKCVAALVSESLDMN